MAHPKSYHVLPSDEGWAIKSSRRIVGRADTREAAVDAAIRAAKQKHAPQFSVTVSFREEQHHRLSARGRHRPTRR